MKRYLLTDFNTERWKGVDMESVESQIGLLNEKINTFGFVYGEVGNPDLFDISLTRVSHLIRNLSLEDGRVYGDVRFLENDNGKLADSFINELNCRFGIRSAGVYRDGEVVIKSIFTWDVINDE